MEVDCSCGRMGSSHTGNRPSQSEPLAPPPDLSPDALRALLAPGHLTLDGERCPTCTGTIRERYCAVCGEERPSAHPQTIIGFLRRVFARVFDADNRLYQSLQKLVLRPGALTVEFLRGRRRPYLGPIQLFALINVAFYLWAASSGPNTFRTPLYIHVSSDNFYHRAMAQRWVNEKIGAPPDWSYERARAAADSLDRMGADSSAYAELPKSASHNALQDFRDYADQFDQQALWLSKSLIFLFIPVIAVWFWLIFPTQWWGRSRSGLVPEIVQATHVMGATLLIFMSAIVPALTMNTVRLLFGGESIGITERWFEVWLNVLLVFYLTVSFRRVQEASWVGAVLRAAVIPLVFIELLLGYRAVLFFVGFFTA